MNGTRWMGLAAVAFSLVATAGCASRDAAMAPSKSAEAPPAPESPASEEILTGGSEAPTSTAPAEPAGASPSEAPSDDAAPAPPPPAPAPVTQSAPSAGRAASAKPKTSTPARPAKKSEPDRQEEAKADASARPGLGTEWGETRTSQISIVPFVRATPTAPFTTAALFYNDEQGARAMSGTAGFRRTASQAFTIAGGAVSIGLRGENGRFLNGFVASDKNFVVGEAGNRYTIVLRNLTDNRFECVVSVDGLDVLDGQAGAFSKRGYLLDPHGEVEIDGFRQSMESVAAFRFGSVRNSYANKKHGEARNVGVIGVALFHERGATLWTPEEIERRNKANPFPGQFATPPSTP